MDNIDPETRELLEDPNEFPTLQAHAEAVRVALEVTFKVHFVGHRSMPWDQNGVKRDVFRCTFIREGSTFSTLFGQSINDSNSKGSFPPDFYDIAACLEKHEPESWPDWAYEFGYDLNNKKSYLDAAATHKRCVEQYERLSAFFTPEELNLLSNIS